MSFKKKKKKRRANHRRLRQDFCLGLRTRIVPTCTGSCGTQRTVFKISSGTYMTYFSMQFCMGSLTAKTRMINDFETKSMIQHMDSKMLFLTDGVPLGKGSPCTSDFQMCATVRRLAASIMWGKGKQIDEKIKDQCTSRRSGRKVQMLRSLSGSCQFQERRSSGRLRSHRCRPWRISQRSLQSRRF